MLATILWDGGAGTSNWHDAANWDGDVLPTATDDVVIDLPDVGTVNVTSDVEIQSLDSQTASLSVTGGTFRLSADSSISRELILRTTLDLQGNLSVQEGVTLGHVIPNGTSTRFLPGLVTGSGDLTVTGNLAWRIGTMAGTGTTVVAGAMTITDEAYFSQTFTESYSYLQRKLENRGQTTITSGRFYLGKANSSIGGTLLNAIGATLTLDDGGGIRSAGSGTNLLENQGTVQRGPSGNSPFIAAPFVSSGTVRVAQSTLELVNPGISQISGPVELTGGSLILKSPLTLESGASVSGSGKLNVRSDLIVNGDVSVENLEIGHVIYNGTSTQYFPGLVTGPGNLTVTGNLDWRLGMMTGTGTTVVAGAMTITDESYFTHPDRLSHLQRKLENRGQTTITSDRFYLGKANSSEGGTLLNAIGATLTLDDGGGIRSAGSGTNLLENQGTVQRGPSGNNAFIAAPFVSSGTVRVAQSMLELINPGVSLISGPVELTGGNLILKSPHTLESGASVSGSGKLSVRSDLFINAAVSVENMDLGHVFQNGTSSLYFPGLVTGPGDLTVTGNLAWRLGTMAGTGTTVVAGAMTITDESYFTHSNRLSYLQRKLENRGQTTITSDRFYLGKANSSVGATLHNVAGATLTLNASTLRATGNGTLLLENDGIITGSGSVPVHTLNRGRIFVVGGSLNLSTTVNELGGVLSAEVDTLAIDGDLTLGDLSVISSRLSGSVAVKGSILGTTTAETLFTPNGKLVLNGENSSTSPQQWEVMSRDLGPVISGFDENFSYGSVELKSTYVRLQDSNKNALGTATEAIYIDTLQVDSASTLDLSGLPLYVRQTNIAGTVIGDYTVVGDSGPLIFNSRNPGQISSRGQVDEWTFYGRAGSAVTIFADPGSPDSNLVFPKYLGVNVINLIAPDGSEVFSGESASAGGIVTANGVELDQEGIYRITVTGKTRLSTGNYDLSIFDSTVDVSSLLFNEREIGFLETPHSVDRWTFVAEENDQVRLDVLGSQVRDLRWSLRGPGGWVGFENQMGGSELLVLPSTGQYTLQANATGIDDGAFTFELLKTNVTQLSLNQSYSGMLPAIGTPRLFRVDTTDTGPLRFQLSDENNSNSNELYVGFGKPPTRRDYSHRAVATGSSHQIDVPFAASGSWFVLVYGRDVVADSPFTVTASAVTGALNSVVPASSLPSDSVYLTLSGVGFLPRTTVELVNGAGDVFAAGEVSIDAPAQLSARFDLSGRVLGDYDVRVTFPGGATDTLENGFLIDAAGEPQLDVDLIMPSAIGAFSTATLYVEYANRGDVAMPAPVLTVEPFDPVDGYKPKLTLDRAILRARFWSTALLQGFDSSVQIYAQGEMPGWLQPGERILVPVYYGGTGDPGGRDDRLVLRVRQADDNEAVDWASYIADSKPETVSQDAWEAVAANLATLFGSTWSEYLATLSENASYLARNGRTVSNVDELFSFIYRQANGIGVVPVLAAATDASVPVPGIGLSYGRTFGNTITERYNIGPFGRGWRAPSQASATADSEGVVRVVERAGLVRTFEPDRRYGNRFVSGPGETGSLRRLGDGSHELRETSGLLRRFDTDGKLQFIQDADGNQLTYAYDGDQLSSLSHSSGESISFVYNTAGLIESITDSNGWTTSYSYDPSTQLLLSATNPAGTTTYTYVSGQGPQREYALASIEDATGVIRSFEYDALGRLVTSYVGADEARVEYSYSGPGQVTITVTVHQGHGRRRA